MIGKSKVTRGKNPKVCKIGLKTHSGQKGISETGTYNQSFYKGKPPKNPVRPSPKLKGTAGARRPKPHGLPEGDSERHKT